MAINKTIINVNNGQTGWTRGHVIDALEQAFTTLGWHGPADAGIFCGFIVPIAPTQPWPYPSSWATQDVGGTAPVNATGLISYTYTVPASGGRSAADLVIYRYGTNYTNGNLVGKVHSVGLHYLIDGNKQIPMGWSSSDTFTIPGTATGGSSPANDIVIGPTADTTRGAVAIGNSGTTGTFYSKLNTGVSPYGVLKVVNDANKSFGTTFYSFNVIDDRTLTFNAGPRLWLNEGSNFEDANYTKYGVYPFNGTRPGLALSGMISPCFRGSNGVDWQSQSAGQVGLTTQGAWEGSTNIRFASSSSPTSYPLQIRLYRTQFPQDQNFVIIQFTQTVNSNIIPYGSFFLQKGTNHGSGIWDLSQVFQGSIGSVCPAGDGRSMILSALQAQKGYFSPNESAEPPSSGFTLTRESLYGYFRGDANGDYLNIGSDTYHVNYQPTGGASYWINNIDDAAGVTSGTIVPYYRNATIDQTAASYYKVIKGIPWLHCLAPVPYYLPDDFVMIQVNQGPGLTNFRTGDTVTVSASEVYEIVYASFLNNQTDLGNVANAVTKGILFCARTV